MDPKSRLRTDSSGVSTVTGYIMTFFIASIILGITILSSQTLVSTYGDVVARRSLETIGTNLVLRIVQMDRVIASAGASASDIAAVNTTIEIPLEAGKQPYTIDVTDTALTLQTKEGSATQVKIPLNISTPLIGRTISSGGGKLDMVYDPALGKLDVAYEGGGAENALYNATKGAPECVTGFSPCTAKSDIIKSRDSIGGTVEPNQPNTLDACTDGAAGAYQSDESVDQIKITDLTDNTFTTGDTVRVEVKVYCFTSGTCGSSGNCIDVFYTTDAASPSWSQQGSASPCAAGQGFQTHAFAFPLGSPAGTHAVRGVLRYNEVASACPGSAWSDKDDVAFVVR
ncbi:MAG: hypothetical protein QXO51_07475 [Halobacteria archaeon]